MVHRVTFLLFYKPGSTHMSALRTRAEEAVLNKIVSNVPTFETYPVERSALWRIVVTCEEIDRAFWLGFAQGLDFARNNRQIAVGVES